MVLVRQSKASRTTITKTDVSQYTKMKSNDEVYIIAYYSQLEMCYSNRSQLHQKQLELTNPRCLGATKPSWS